MKRYLIILVIFMGTVFAMAAEPTSARARSGNNFLAINDHVYEQFGEEASCEKSSNMTSVQYV